MLLLHISDIHFRKGEVGTAMDPYAHIRNELLLDAEKMCIKIGSAPDAILITGDLTFAGDPDEFDFALVWLKLLCEKCGTELKNIFVVPGNHDAVRSVSSQRVIQSLHHEIKNTTDLGQDSLVSGLLNDSQAGSLLYESLDNYNNFANQFFCDLLPPERTIAKRDLVLNDGSVLRFIGLNSTFVSSEADKAGELFIDPAVNSIIRESGVENIVLCHHPYNWLRQGNTLCDHLNDVACIQLFGHEHTNRIDLGKEHVRISASAAHPNRTERGWEPGYNLIELEVQGEDANRRLDVRAHVRVLQQRPTEFRAKTNHGEDVFHQVIDLNPWTKPTTKSADLIEPVADKPEQKATSEEVKTDPMDTLRDISVRFFKLSLSQKSAIAGKLNLLESEDMNQPDFERFRRVLIRARERGQIVELISEVQSKEAENNHN